MVETVRELRDEVSQMRRPTELLVLPKEKIELRGCSKCWELWIVPPAV